MKERYTKNQGIHEAITEAKKEVFDSTETQLNRVARSYIDSSNENDKVRLYAEYQFYLGYKTCINNLSNRISQYIGVQDNIQYEAQPTDENDTA